MLPNRLNVYHSKCVLIKKNMIICALKIYSNNATVTLLLYYY